MALSGAIVGHVIGLSPYAWSAKVKMKLPGVVLGEGVRLQTADWRSDSRPHFTERKTALYLTAGAVTRHVCLSLFTVSNSLPDTFWWTKCSPICNCRMSGQCICHSSRPKLKWAFLLCVYPLMIISPLAWCSIVAETSLLSPPQCLFNQNTCKRFPLDLRKPSRCQSRFSSPYLYFFLLSIFWGFCITSHQRAVSQATPCFSSFPGAQEPCFHGFYFQLDNVTSNVYQL